VNSTEHEDSSAVKAEDAKFADSGEHHRPNRGCGAGATRRRIDGKPKDRDSGRTEELAIGASEGPKRQGETGARKVGGARGKRRFGATRRFSLAEPEGGAAEATRWIHHLAPEDADAGRPADWSSAIPNERGTGRPGNVPSAPPKGAPFESPRRYVAGKAGRRRERGNSPPTPKAQRKA